MSGKIGRIGIDVKTKVKVHEHSYVKFSIRGGRLVKIPRVEYFDAEMKGKLMLNGHLLEWNRPRPVKDVDLWLSDHFGIAIGVKVV